MLAAMNSDFRGTMVAVHWLVFASLLCAAPRLGAKTPEQIFQQVSRSVVVLHTYDKEGNPLNQGGGVVIARGEVVTNCHVVYDAARILVQHGKNDYEATLRYTDLDRDLCQITVARLDAPRVVIGEAARLRVGQRVYAIGAPEGLDLTISEGLISSIREFEGERYLQTSAAISQGSSGGGLFDTEGRLVGITGFIVAEGQNINFALPANWIAELSARTATTAEGGGTAVARWEKRAAALRAKKDWLGLLRLTQQWVRTMPTNAVAWRQLGDAYRTLGRHRRAVPAYMQAVRLDSESGELWHGLGISYMRLHQYERAIESFDEALRLKPQNVAALFSMGEAYYLQNRHDKVKEVHASLQKRDARVAQEFARRYLKQ